MPSYNLTLVANFQTAATVITYGELIDTRDNNKKYKTVKIGDHTWMAENLNYQTSSGSWCYDNTSSNCTTYGRLYDWSTARTACPVGWRLPTREDWSALVAAAGDDNAGTKLKAKSPDWNGTNDYGFSALPGGYRYNSGSGSLIDVGSWGYWWTATESIASHAYYRVMSADYAIVSEGDYGKDMGLSIRCVQN
jgi:uncharacterized protein (TIGR02145 family)